MRSAPTLTVAAAAIASFCLLVAQADPITADAAVDCGPACQDAPTHERYLLVPSRATAGGGRAAVAASGQGLRLPRLAPHDVAATTGRDRSPTCPPPSSGGVLLLAL